MTDWEARNRATRVQQAEQRVREIQERRANRKRPMISAVTPAVDIDAMTERDAMTDDIDDHDDTPADVNADIRYVDGEGRVHSPHIYRDRCYRIATNSNRATRTIIRIPEGERLAPLVERGFHVRMSAPGVPPGLISPETLLGRKPTT